MVELSPAKPAIAGAAGPQSQALAARARGVFPGGVTHDNRYTEGAPIYIDRAEGSHKWDVDGREYIDYWMGHGALLLGHTPPAIVEAVTEQIRKGTHYGGSSALEVRWGELVQRLVPSAERVKFTASGTEAAMLAVRLARAFTGRGKFLKFTGHFHGWSDPMTVAFQFPFDVPSSVGIPRAVVETVVAIPPNDLAALDEALAADDDIACVIVEPTGASYGTVPLDDGFLAGVRDLTRRHDVLLIFDEVVTGFRYAPGGIQEITGLVPDLTTLAKILAGGLPGGAVAGRADIMAALDFKEGDATWNRYRRIHHPGTFNANPLSAAAGVAMLESIADGAVQRQVNAAGERLAVALNAALAEIGATRSCVYALGSIFHVLLGQGGRADAQGRLIPGSVTPETLRQANPGPIKTAFQAAMRRRGVDLMSGQVGMVSSAHTEADFAGTVSAFKDAVQEVRDGLGSAL
jgi:glutamate-1-semialdehyde 2,1-aminomutase